MWSLKRVSTLAVRLTQLLRVWALASSPVLIHGHDFEVRGVHTGSDATEMVELETLWDGAAIELIGDPMGGRIVRLIDAEASVSILRLPCSPEPAITSSINVALEPFRDG
jgi:hypothetical protein